MSDLETLAKGHGADARHARRRLKRQAAAREAGGGLEFAPLIDELDGIAARIASGERKRLGRAIAKDLRRANAVRIRRNVEPDGEEMAPRKRRKSGRLRSKRLRDGPRSPKKTVRQPRMFARASQPRFLRTESTVGDAQVGFVGAMARIMRVHQYGLRDTVTRDPQSPAITYPARVVLGMDHADRIRILDTVAAQVAP